MIKSNMTSFTANKCEIRSKASTFCDVLGIKRLIHIIKVLTVASLSYTLIP